MRKATVETRDDSVVDWDRIKSQILAGLDVKSEFEALGVVFPPSGAKSEWTANCHAAGREDASPSATVHVPLGLYCDWGRGGKVVSLFDLAWSLGVADSWLGSIRIYADKAGFELPFQSLL